MSNNPYSLENYYKFLDAKIDIAEWQGFTADNAALHLSNFPHQNDVIKWALRMGRGLIAMSFGLGKTSIGIEIAKQIHSKTGGQFLTVCPLGVKHQFIEEDGPRLGIKMQYVYSDETIRQATSPYLVTNYERIRDGNITPSLHNIMGVNLDEGSTLRSLGSKTYQIFNETFAKTPYKYVSTATPSPNNFRELINYADFLDIMDRGQALTRFFQRDVNKAGNLTLHPQHEEKFWLWVASWALFVYKPSDLGYDDAGYNLPELKVHYHRLEVDHRRAWSQTDSWGQHRLFLNAAAGVREAVNEKRATLDTRIEYAADIVNSDDPTKHWLIWHHLEDERHAIKDVLPECTTVYGSQDIEVREKGIMDFSHGKIRILATKPEIAGSGCNFQRYCADNIFVGVDYRFQDFIQAIHRTYRFQQLNDVNVHIIYSESEDDVVAVLRRKWAQHDKLTAKMQTIVKKYGLTHLALEEALKRTITMDREIVKGDYYTAILSDNTPIVHEMPDDHADMILTSIPFGNHYEYTTYTNDYGHNPTDNEFWEQMDFLTGELLRITKPGRVAAIHVKDRILYGHQTKSGVMEVSPFSDECVMHFRKHGWLYEGRRTIVTDVVRENNSTYRLGWTEMTKDATKMGSGLPEYVLLFRKKPTDVSNAYADEMVKKTKDVYTRAEWQINAHSFWRSNGDRPLLPEERYSYDEHVKRLQALEEHGNLPSSFFYEPPISYSEYVWDDINFMQGLNSEQSRKRLQNHTCPLPFDIVNRLIELYSNPDDLIVDPFGGLLTTAVCAVKLNRLALIMELWPPYFYSGLRYLKDAELERKTPTLFDWLETLDAKELQAR